MCYFSYESSSQPALKLMVEELVRKKRRRVGAGVFFSMPSLNYLLFLNLFFLLCFLGDRIAAEASLNFTGMKRRVSVLRLARIQSHLDKINKPAVRTIQSPDGDTINCVLSHKQPALDHPLLKNHTIQRAAPQRPSFSSWRSVDESTTSKRSWQSWHHVGHCPKGTIPIRKSSVDDVLRAKSLYHYGKKQQRRRQPITSPAARGSNAPDIISGNGHEV